VPGSISAAPADEPVEKLPIGDMRTLLQLHLAVLIAQLPSRVQGSAVAWVLDDDKRLIRKSGGELD
jgi:hypothetical protein